MKIKILFQKLREEAEERGGEGTTRQIQTNTTAAPYSLSEYPTKHT